MKTVDEPMSKDWHYHPDLPVKTSPLFAWPFNPLTWLQWMASSWLRLSPLTLWVALSVVILVALLPEKAAMENWGWGWVAQIYLLNLTLAVSVGGGLHLYFYALRRQGDRKRFDSRAESRGGRKFTFKSQLLDNMFWTLASGVTVWTAYACAYFWAWANGFVPMLTWADSPVAFLAWFLVIPIWSSMHFYWVHRWLHWPPLYRLAHALHHRNINIGPWSGISMHPVEHLLYFSSVVPHLVLASHPIHVLFHFMLQGLSPMCSHSGYEGIEVAGRTRVRLGDFYHQLHHRYFECNYGTPEMPWDTWFGTFHDGGEEATRLTRERVKRTRAKWQARPIKATA